MSVHPRKFIVALSEPKPVQRQVYLFCGIPVTAQFSRRPRVLRLEPSKARSRGRDLAI